MSPFLALLVCLVAPAGAAYADAGGEPLTLAAGERRTGDLVALGRDVVVAGELGGVLVALGGTVRIRGRVTGDALLFLTRAELDGAGRVDGDVLTVGGDLRFENGASPASIGGRLVSVAALEAAFLAELATSPLRATAVSPLLLSFRLLLLAVWLVAGLALLFLGPRRLAAAAGFASAHLLRATAIGLSAFLAGVLLAAFLLAVAPARPAFVLVGAIALALLAAKAFGLAAVFLLVGRRIARSARRGTLFWGDPAALAVGLLALGLVSLVPGAGALVWSVASLAGIGLAVATSFGRAEA